jgi:hypothetical protein
MTFREQLNKANELNLSILDLSIANECDSVFNFEYTEKQFEELCALARQAFLKGEYVDEYALAQAINDLIVEEEKTIGQVLSMTAWELLDKATCYC